MILYYFNLNTNRFPDVVNKNIKNEKEITYIKTNEYEVPVVVVKLDNNLVEDVMSHSIYSLTETNNMLSGYIVKEIDYEEYSSLTKIIGSTNINHYIECINHLSNILIEKENIRKEKNNNKNKERLLIV